MQSEHSNHQRPSRDLALWRRPLRRARLDRKLLQSYRSTLDAHGLHSPDATPRGDLPLFTTPGSSRGATHDHTQVWAAATGMTIRSKLALGLFSIAIVLLLPLALALQSLEQLHATTTLLQKREFAASLLLNRMRSSTDELRRLDLPLLFVTKPENRIAMDSQLAALSAMADSLRNLGMVGAADKIGASVDKIAVYVPAEYAAAVCSVAADTRRLERSRRSASATVRLRSVLVIAGSRWRTDIESAAFLRPAAAAAYSAGT